MTVGLFFLYEGELITDQKKKKKENEKKLISLTNRKWGNNK